jgi:amino acid transporter
MKIVEKIGWLVVLISLVITVVTVIYGVIKVVGGTIIELFRVYHNNLTSVLFVAVISGVVGIFLIRLGATDKEPDA